LSQNCQYFRQIRIHKLIIKLAPRSDEEAQLAAAFEGPHDGVVERVVAVLDLAALAAEQAVVIAGALEAGLGSI
jgi:hypothetical protein